MLATPSVEGLSEVVRVLGQWQYDAAPVPLHPGDLGWYWRFGAEATAAALRTWSGDGQILAIGLLDGPDILRLALAPEALDNEELAHTMLTDVARPERGVLPQGNVSIEARCSGRFKELLIEHGWQDDEPWTPLRRDVTDPVPDCGLRVEVVGPERADVRAALQGAAFDRSTLTSERWLAMAAGPAYADAQCLIGYDKRDNAVAAVTVWSAGQGRPGLLEPMGVHREHRGHGYGTAITLAAAAALRELGSSSATVCTKSSNVVGVATYISAGFHPHPPVPDLSRGA